MKLTDSFLPSLLLTLSFLLNDVPMICFAELKHVFFLSCREPSEGILFSITIKTLELSPDFALVLVYLSFCIGLEKKMSRSSRPVRRHSVKKILKIPQNSQENNCASVSFLIKLQAPDQQLYLKRDYSTGVFL